MSIDVATAKREWCEREEQAYGHSTPHNSYARSFLCAVNSVDNKRITARSELTASIILGRA